MNRQHAVLLILTLGALLCLASSAHAGDAEAGKAVFDTNCTSCHGSAGKGDGPIAFTLKPPPRDFSTGEFKLDANKSGAPGEDEDLKLVIKNGGMPYGGSVLMAGWPTLNDAQLDDVIAYIRSLKE